jgi:hypothetical protein
MPDQPQGIRAGQAGRVLCVYKVTGANMRYTSSSDLSPVETVVQARQAYRGILAKRGLANFSPAEFDTARTALKVEGGSDIEIDDLAFQAAMTRLQSRKSLPPHAMEELFREIIVAEYECDQAEYERDCWRAADIEHSIHKVMSKKANV